MTWVAAAVIGSSVIGAGASIAGSNRAAREMRRSEDANIALQERIFNQQRDDLAPFREIGGSALNAYARAMGLPQFNQNAAQRAAQAPFSAQGRINNAETVQQLFREVLGREAEPEAVQYYMGRDIGQTLEEMRNSTEYATRARAGSLPGRELGQGEFMGGSQTSPDSDPYGGFMASPGYQFVRDQGQQGIDRNMAARGLLNSGARGRELSRFNQGLASQEFGNYMNRLAGAAGIGQSATNSTNAFASSYAGNVANSNTNRGMARASGYLGAANAINSGINNVLGALPYRAPRPGTSNNLPGGWVDRAVMAGGG